MRTFVDLQASCPARVRLYRVLLTLLNQPEGVTSQDVQEIFQVLKHRQWLCESSLRVLMENWQGMIKKMEADSLEPGQITLDWVLENGFKTYLLLQKDYLEHLCKISQMLANLPVSDDVVLFPAMLSTPVLFSDVPGPAMPSTPEDVAIREAQSKNT